MHWRHIQGVLPRRSYVSGDQEPVLPFFVPFIQAWSSRINYVFMYVYLKCMWLFFPKESTTTKSHTLTHAHTNTKPITVSHNNYTFAKTTLTATDGRRWPKTCSVFFLSRFWPSPTVDSLRLAVPVCCCYPIMLPRSMCLHGCKILTCYISLMITIIIIIIRRTGEQIRMTAESFPAQAE